MHCDDVGGASCRKALTSSTETRDVAALDWQLRHQLHPFPAWGQPDEMQQTAQPAWQVATPAPPQCLLHNGSLKDCFSSVLT